MMFTLCWIGKGEVPMWERLGSVEQVNNFIRKKHLTDNDSLFIFGREADDFALSKDDFDEIYNIK